MKSLIILVLCILLIGSSAEPKPKEPIASHLRGIQGMGYYPMLPYGMLGYKPSMLYGNGLKPGFGLLSPDVVHEEGKAPLTPYYGDMGKMVGYGGLMMPYGGYGYPMLNGYQ